MNRTGAVPDISELADRSAIHDVLAVHCRGVDRADEAALKSAYWPDAQVAYGGFEGLAHEFCAMLPKSIVRFTHTQHSISNIVIRFADRRSGAVRQAAVETYVTAYHYLVNDTDEDTDKDTGIDSEMTFLGRYLDRFECRDSVWKILHRRVLMDWNQNSQASAIWQGPPFDGLARGARFPDDPMYALFDQIETGEDQE